MNQRNSGSSAFSTSIRLPKPVSAAPLLRLIAVARSSPTGRFVLPILITVFSAAVGLAGMELACRLIVDRLAVHSYEVPRNPYNDRFWLAYTQPRPRLTDRLVIVISNSQGSLLEGKGADCYSARLEARLNAHDTRHTYTVANWSVPGSNAGEYVVLAARAVDHQPDAVILASFSNNFSTDQTRHPLSFARNDIEQIGYMPSVRARLSPKFIKHFKINRRRGKLAAYSGLLNLHDSLAFWIRDPRAKEDREWSRRPNKPPIRSEPVAESGERMLEEIHTVLRRGLPQTPVLVVNMPLNREKIVPESWPHTEDFFTHTRRIFIEAQFSVLDARDLAVPERYYTATHLDPQGHEQFARWLEPQILAHTAHDKSGNTHGI